LSSQGLVVAVFGQMRAADIEPQHVRQYLDARTAKVAANREKALLSHVLTVILAKADAPLAAILRLA
jgi:hypothetical protein